MERPLGSIVAVALVLVAAGAFVLGLVSPPVAYIADNELLYNVDPCSGPSIMHVHWVVTGAAPGATSFST